MNKTEFLATMKLEPADEDYRAWTLDYLVEDGVVLHFRIVQQMPDFADTWFTAYVDPYDAKEADDRFTVSYPNPEDSWARYAELLFLGRRFEPHGGYTASLGWDYAHCGDEGSGWTAVKVAEDIWAGVAEWLNGWTPRGTGHRRAAAQGHERDLDPVDVLFARLGRVLGHSRYNQLTHGRRCVELWETARGCCPDDTPDYDDELLADISPADGGTDTVLVRLPDGRSSEVPTTVLKSLLEMWAVYHSDMERLVEDAKGAGVV